MYVLIMSTMLPLDIDEPMSDTVLSGPELCRMRNKIRPQRSQLVDNGCCAVMHQASV